MQEPAIQLANPPATDPHELPHLPQFATSVCTFEQLEGELPSSRPAVDKHALAEKIRTADSACFMIA